MLEQDLHSLTVKAEPALPQRPAPLRGYDDLTTAELEDLAGRSLRVIDDRRAEPGAIHEAIGLRLTALAHLERRNARHPSRGTR